MSRRLLLFNSFCGWWNECSFSPQQMKVFQMSKRSLAVETNLSSARQLQRKWQVAPKSHLSIVQEYVGGRWGKKLLAPSHYPDCGAKWWENAGVPENRSFGSSSKDGWESLLLPWMRLCYGGLFLLLEFGERSVGTCRRCVSMGLHVVIMHPRPPGRHIGIDS